MGTKENAAAAIGGHFARSEDPRVNRRRRHKLINILVIGICTVICGGDDYPAMRAFGKCKHESSRIWEATQKRNLLL